MQKIGECIKKKKKKSCTQAKQRLIVYKYESINYFQKQNKAKPGLLRLANDATSIPFLDGLRS